MIQVGKIPFYVCRTKFFINAYRHFRLLSIS
jgi:hypothetical protein